MPWEGNSIKFLAGVYRNPTQEQFRMWYVCNASVDRYRHFVCIAESNDGTHWSRPDLDCYRNLTDGPNNIVYATSQKLDGPTILYDPDDPISWKLVFYRGGSVFVGESKDGIQWKMPDEQDQPVLPNFGDGTTSLLDAPSQEPIVIFSRDRDDMQQLQKVRCIYRIGLSDPRTVRSQSQLILRPDLEDGPYVEFYQMSVFRYESVFLGLIERYHTAEPPYADVELTVSRDSKQWRRVRPRMPFLGPPAGGRELGAFDSGCSTPGNSPPLRIGDALWFYYYGRPGFHGDRHMTHAGSIGIAKLRVDGFVSLRSGRREGCVTTKPFTWNGGTLQINARIEGGNLWNYKTLQDADGGLRVEVLDDAGRSIQGLSSDDCDPLYRDSIAYTPSWRGEGQNALKQLEGQQIKFRFMIRAGDLYSFGVKA